MLLYSTTARPASLPLQVYTILPSPPTPNTPHPSLQPCTQLSLRHRLPLPCPYPFPKPSQPPNSRRTLPSLSPFLSNRLESTTFIINFILLLKYSRLKLTVGSLTILFILLMCFFQTNLRNFVFEI